MSKHNFIIKV